MGTKVPTQCVSVVNFPRRILGGEGVDGGGEGVRRLGEVWFKKCGKVLKR